MINREDMLELTRRMNLQRNCFARIAGRYCDEEGFEDGSFNTNFLKLTPHERNVNIAIAKAVPFAETNVALKEYEFGDDADSKQFKFLLSSMKSCELKNDALMETFYDVVTEKYLPMHKGGDFAIYVFYGAYDIKVKAADKSYLDDSEVVYDFLICTICPVHGDYETGEPMCGFLWPAFKDRNSDPDYINVYRKH